MNSLTILCTSRHPTLSFAALELRKYLRLISDTSVDIAEAPPHGCHKIIQIGLFDELSIRHSYPAEPDFIADEIHVEITAGQGRIGGINPRSVLLAVYRFLHQVGVRFLYPGNDGEVIPKFPLLQLSATLSERPSRRHRGICIEGATSLEHALDLIDWSVKLGYSAYFLQFKDAGVFFEKWYTHWNNDTLEPESFSPERARELSIRLEEALRLRSMIYHAVGHGWHCEVLGYTISSWGEADIPLPEENRQYLAQRDGKRELFWDRPMITALCYGNPEVQKRMVECAVKYTLAHPEIDILHFWIDDGPCLCECEKCKLPVADYYIPMLNELDAELTRQHCPTKIVFLAYGKLLWTPKTDMRLHNPERFIFMYANSRRLYKESLLAGPDKELPSWPPNSEKRAIGNSGEIRAFLNAWLELFQGDNFHFEYYSTLCKFNFDPIGIARLIGQDVIDQRALNLDGIMSCQLQRNACPTAIVNYMLGRMLWNQDNDPSAIIQEYFEAAYGVYAPKVIDLLEAIGRNFENSHSLPLFAWEKGDIEFSHDAEKMLATVQTKSEDLLALCQESAKSATKTGLPYAWKQTAFFSRLMQHSAKILQTIATQSEEDVSTRWASCKAFICNHEMAHALAFDATNFIDTLDSNYVQRKAIRPPGNELQ
jgi:hypothetical protein